MESLRFRGRPVAWLGVGDPDAVGPGIAALQAAVTQYGGAGITNPSGAVVAFQAAGNAAVGSVGPAIDARSGNDPTVMGATHLAWVDNGKLANINAGPTAAQSDVDAAKAIVADMVNQYQVAQRLAASKVSAATGSTQASASKTTSGTAPKIQMPATITTPDDTVALMSPWTWAAIGTGVVAVVVGGIIIARRAA